MRKGLQGLIILLGLCVMAAGDVSAGAVISNGTVSLGVNDQGHLNFGGVGLAFAGVGDGIFPGCLCEGWGVAGSGIVGTASVDNSPGVTNLSLDSFNSTASTATSNVFLTTLPNLHVSHAFAPSATSALYESIVTISNTSGAAITDIRYRRAMDWDIPPTEFHEFVTIQGLPAANLLHSSDNGFANVSPLAAAGAINPGTENVNFTDVIGPVDDDHGAVFTFGFGDLAAGQSKSFSIFYGAAPDEASALAALATVNAELYSFGQSNTPDGPTLGTPATFIFGFKGIGGRSIGEQPGEPGVIPEPASLLLFGMGLAGAAIRRKRVS